MMRNRFIFMMFVFSFFACQNERNNDLSKTDDRQILLDSIEEIETDLHSDLELDMEKGRTLTEAYIRFADKYKNDSLVPEFLFRAAEISLNMNEPVQACSYLFRIEKKYDWYENMPAVLYFLGYIHADYLNDMHNAKIYFDLFLTRYPNHERVQDITFFLDNMNKSDLEIIRQFEQNQIDSLKEFH
jgi:hypothetical protein